MQSKTIKEKRYPKNVFLDMTILQNDKERLEPNLFDFE